MADRLMRADLAADDAPPKIDTTVAHIARVYDYWLGGKDHFVVDRAVGVKVLEIHPETVLSVRANRAFLARSVRYLAATEGVRQFLDIGTGLPSANNTHEVAQAAAPAARVVYVDNDPIVLAHARALLTSSQDKEEGRCWISAAGRRDAARVLHMLRDEEDPGGTHPAHVRGPGRQLPRRLHLASDVQTETMAEMRAG